MDTSSIFGTGIEGPAHWSLRLLDDFQLSKRGSGEKVALPGKRERVLLAYLALSPNGRQPRRKLVTLLWGEAADETTLENLRTSVFNLRKALGDTERRIIASEDRDIVLDASAFEVDVLAFRRLAAGPGVAELEAAASLYGGEFLEGLGIQSEEFESWRREEATRSKDQVLEVLSRLMAQLADTGETERAIEAGSRILRIEPLHEPAVRRLMRLYDQSDRRGTAVQLYRTLSETLKAELNAQPKAETRAVYAEITRGDEKSATPAATVPAEAKSPSPVSVAPNTVRRSIDVPHEPAPPAQQIHTAIAAPQSVATPGVKTRKLNWILAGGAVAIVALFLVYEIAGRPGATPAQQTRGEAAKAASVSQAGAISIAVLPFVNLSSDKEQEFFSDGMTEEITSALAKVAGLNVIARTSAFQFKGENKDMRAIGQALGASHLIEGSVRKDGNEVRITAQLIRAGDGTQLWTESYDRELKGIFAVQEDIAKAIAASLSVPLGLKAGQTLVSNRMSDTESYQDYLRARALVRAGRGGAREPGGPLTQAAKLLEQVVARDPNYAPAWGLLAQAYARIPTNTAARNNGPNDELPRIRAEFLQKAETAVQQAIRLDPNGSDGYLALASLQGSRHLHAAAEDSYKQALSLDSGNPDALHAYANALAVLGRVKESLVMRLRLQGQEPLVPVFNGATAAILSENGRTDEAIAILKTLPVQGPQPQLAEAYASIGRYSDAVDVLQRKPAGATSPQILEEAIRLLRTAPAQTAAPRQTALSRTAYGFVYLFVGAPDRALDYYEGLLEAGISNAAESKLWGPDYAPVRKTERFKAHVRKAGLVDYWKVRGWPDLCRPTIGDDFECN